MSNRDEVKAKFLSLLEPYVRRQANEPIGERTHLIDDLHVNSARFVDILLETEERFDISIDDESADRLHTVGDAVDLILEKTAVKA